MQNMQQHCIMEMYFEQPFFYLGLILQNINMQERYKFLKEKNTRSLDQHSKDFEQPESLIGISLDKSLNDALATFDSLFCRQCIVHTKTQPFNILVIVILPSKILNNLCLCLCHLFQQIFDCPLHGCSQPIYPVRNNTLCSFKFNM